MKPKKVFNKDGSYRWLIDYYDPQGKRIKRRFKKLAEANAVLDNVGVAKLEGTYGEVFGKKQEPVYKFEDLARDYLAAYQGQKNFKDKRQVVEKVLTEQFGGKGLANITYLQLELFRSERLQSSTHHGKQRSLARINREFAVMRHMLNKAVQWGKLIANPFAKGGSLHLKENNFRTRYLTFVEANRLLAEAPDHLKLIIETALNTGMRKGEILGLKWDQIRDGWIYLEPGMTKSGQGRPVSINDAQTEVFRELRAQVQLKSPYVFSVRNNAKKSFASACRRAGIEDFRFHDLRHTCASWLVMAGVSLKVVQEQLGHADIKTTMRYAHLAPGHMKAAINLIGTRVLDVQKKDKSIYR